MLTAQRLLRVMTGASVDQVKGSLCCRRLSGVWGRWDQAPSGTTARRVAVPDESAAHGRSGRPGLKALVELALACALVLAAADATPERKSAMSAGIDQRGGDDGWTVDCGLPPTPPNNARRGAALSG